MDAGDAMPSCGGIPFNQPIEVDMKTLLTALACVSFLAACKKEEPVPVVVAPVAVVPAAPAASPPPATANGGGTSSMAATSTSETSSSGSSGSLGSSAAGTAEGSGDGVYVVKKGDTLWDIADKNAISHGDLAKWNNIKDPRELQVGRKLKLTAP